jgi:hypothetical protein
VWAAAARGGGGHLKPADEAIFYNTYSFIFSLAIQYIKRKNTCNTQAPAIPLKAVYDTIFRIF